MNLWKHFLNNPGAAIYKWHHYFPVYERHFSPWRNRALTFWEIGVLKGGSLEMWQQFFGPFARIVGLDINPRCKEAEKGGIHVRIGDQSDPAFLDSVCEEFGVPDIVLDDGSHYMHDLWATFQHVYPKMGKNGIYAAEDLQTCYWEEYGGGVNRPDTFINRAKSLIDELNADQARGAVKPSAFTRSTFSMCFYDSLIVFEKGDVWRKEAPVTGIWDDPATKPPTVTACTTDSNLEMTEAIIPVRTPDFDPPEPAHQVVSHWQLDAPQPDALLDPTTGHLIVAGWGISATKDQPALQVVLRIGGSTRIYPLEIERKDVIRTILKEDPVGHPNLLCGFYRVVPFYEVTGDLEVGFEADGIIQIVATFSSNEIGNS